MPSNTPLDTLVQTAVDTMIATQVELSNLVQRMDQFVADNATLHTIATSGSYNDLGNKPNLPALYLGKTAKASDSDKLDGHDTGYFATANHNHNTAYLGKTATATNSNKLGGHTASYFATASQLNSSLAFINISASGISLEHHKTETVVGDGGDSGTATVTSVGYSKIVGLPQGTYLITYAGSGQKFLTSVSSTGVMEGTRYNTVTEGVSSHLLNGGTTVTTVNITGVTKLNIP